MTASYNNQFPVALDIAIRRRMQFNAPAIPAAITMSHRLLDLCLYSKLDITPDAISGSGGERNSRLPSAKNDMKGGANGIDIRRTFSSGTPVPSSTPRDRNIHRLPLIPFPTKSHSSSSPLTRRKRMVESAGSEGVEVGVA